MNTNDESKPIELDIQNTRHAHRVDMANLFVNAFYAEDWFSLALNETKNTGKHSRMKEILFAVCAVESYLFEWVRDVVFPGDQKRIRETFDFEDKRGNKEHLGIKKRWKKVIRKLEKFKKLKDDPKRFEGHYWPKFLELVKHRNGLVHGLASRPDSNILNKDEGAVPKFIELTEMHPGWAVERIIPLLRSLHEGKTGSEQPEWLKNAE